METIMKTIEYRVRPVTRYIVTRFHSDLTVADHGTFGKSYQATSGSCGSESCGEFDRKEIAEKIAWALAFKDGPSETVVKVDDRIVYDGQVTGTQLKNESFPPPEGDMP
jgi:hypothetical protein